jgi:hypothetical protein
MGEAFRTAEVGVGLLRIVLDQTLVEEAFRNHHWEGQTLVEEAFRNHHLEGLILVVAFHLKMEVQMEDRI